VDPHGPEHPPHAPPPSLWPIGFAVGIAILLLGLIVGWHIVLLGAVLAVSFGFLWVRDLTAGARAEPVPDVEPERREAGGAPAPEAAAETGMPLATEEEVARYPRSKFLEGATLGLGAAIGGVVTVPVLVMAGGPAFSGGEAEDVDLGPVEDFPEGDWMIATFLSRPDEGEVSRRTAYVRNNGDLNGLPSFTIVSNRCVHLGCPTQPNGPVEQEQAKEIESETGGLVTLIPTSPAGFGCPCHGGQYDEEGNRTAGPPVRSLDRYAFRIENDRLVLGQPYSVGKVEGTGKEAVISKYTQMTPGVHVDGISALLYPIPAPK
jgi:menaquinol-cytochrome c reductase iron-sulfur subunit